MNEYQKNRSREQQWEMFRGTELGQKNSFNQLAALISRIVTNLPQLFKSYATTLFRSVFPESSILGNKASEKENQIKKVLSSQPQLHGPRNPMTCISGLCLMGKKGRTIYPWAPTPICQRFTSRDKQPAPLACMWFSMKQVPVVSHSVASTEKSQSRRQGVHGTGLTIRLYLQEAGLNRWRAGRHSSGWNGRQVKPRRSDMVHEQYLIQSLKY